MPYNRSIARLAYPLPNQLLCVVVLEGRCRYNEMSGSKERQRNKKMENSLLRANSNDAGDAPEI